MRRSSRVRAGPIRYAKARKDAIKVAYELNDHLRP